MSFLKPEGNTSFCDWLPGWVIIFLTSWGLGSSVFLEKGGVWSVDGMGLGQPLEPDLFVILVFSVLKDVGCVSAQFFSWIFLVLRLLVPECSISYHSP